MTTKRNSDNPRRGREFQGLAASVLSDFWGVSFELEVAFPIGNPPKEHRFDLASSDRRFVGEAKCYSWTATGNMPAAKMAVLNEAVLYLSYLPTETMKFIVMPRDIRPRGGEALADYYHRTYRHLLSNVLVIEIDTEKLSVRVLG
jgi:hypothetical protein